MIKETEVLKIGYFTKAHGISGELSAIFTNDVFEELDPEFIICNMDGILVPFFIEEYRFKTDSSAIIKLEDINDDTQARRFMDADFFALKESIQNIEYSIQNYTWSNFIGYHVLDKSVGEVGDIINVDESTLNVLFLVKYAGREILIPVDESLIVSIDDENKLIQMDLPDGLLTL